MLNWVKEGVRQMIRKYLQRRVKIGCDEELGLEKPIELEYYLVESKVDYIPELRGKAVYGMSISKRINGACSEERVVINFSCCEHSTRQMINRLADSAVTHASLEYILDDVLGV